MGAQALHPSVPDGAEVFLERIVIMKAIATLRNFALKFDALLPIALVAFIAISWLTGCNDGGAEYELRAAPPANSGTAGDGGSSTITPPSTDNPTCQHIPYKWELISYNGCMTSPRMTGLIRDQLGGTAFESFFHGKDFATSTGGPLAGQTFVLEKPSANECGPAYLTMVSNSGTVDVKIYRDIQGNPEEVEFYLLDSSLMDEVWLQTHDGSSPSADDYYTQSFSDLMLNVFECYKNVDCTLAKGLASHGKMLPPGIVSIQPVTSEASASGAFCGRMLLIAKSRQ